MVDNKHHLIEDETENQWMNFALENSYSVRVAMTENWANFFTFSRMTLIPRSSDEFNSITRSRNSWGLEMTHSFSSLRKSISITRKVHEQQQEWYSSFQYPVDHRITNWETKSKDIDWSYIPLHLHHYQPNIWSILQRLHLDKQHHWLSLVD